MYKIVILQLLAAGEEKLAQCGVIIDSFIIRVESTLLHSTDIMRRLDERARHVRMRPLFLQLRASLKPVVQAWHTFMTQGTKPAPVLHL